MAISFGVTVLPDPPYSRFLELLGLAEENGFDYGWTYDSHILWQEGHVKTDQTISFHTRSGILTAKLNEDRIELNFPSEPVKEAPLPFSPACLPSPVCTGKNRMDWFVQLATEEDVLNVGPEFLLGAHRVRRNHDGRRGVTRQ